MQSEKIKVFYEGFNEYLIQDKINVNPRHLKIFSYLDDILKSNKIKSAFEIGCGIGIISEYIKRHVPDVYAIDLSEENIKFAKRTVKNVHFESADLLELKPQQSYDLITFFDVLEHIPKNLHLKVFNKIKDLSKEDSLVVITIPDPDYLSYMRKHHQDKLQIVDESISFDDLKLIFNKFNLEILKYEKYGLDYLNQYRFYLLKYKDEEFKLHSPNIHQRNGITELSNKIIRKIKFYHRKIKVGRILKKND